MLNKQLVISKRPSETRIALLEQQQLAELLIENESEKSILGNIYKGKVTRVLPGMQAAFIDIGIGRATFLYAGDVLSKEQLKSRSKHLTRDADEDEDEDGFQPGSPVEEDTREKVLPPIASLLKVGQEILVQVAKEPLGTKGARVTMSLTIPGRYLVYLPQFDHIATSKKVESGEERERLVGLVKEIQDRKCGVIIRTAAQNANANHFKKDLDYLQKTWNKIEQRAKKAKAPSLIYQDLDLIEKTTRDLYSDEIEKIEVDDEELFKKLKNFLRATIPGASGKLSLYQNNPPLFDAYNLEEEVEKSLGKHIDLPSGGYLIIEQTEALTTIDVNTGRYVGKQNADETIFKTNLEAVKKIVSQIRLRNIGGIIVIDLIDMVREDHRERIYSAFNEELKKDRSRVTTLEINPLGLIEMTRKRTRDSLERQLMEPCPYCGGKGRIKTTVTLAHDALRDIERYIQETGERKLIVRARPDIIEWIFDQEDEWLELLSVEFDTNIEFEPIEPSRNDLREPLYEVLSE